MTFQEDQAPSGRRVLARNTVWMTVGQGARVVLQAVYFIIIARTLGASGYGAFVGAVALVAIVAPFASLGAGNLLVMHVARAPDRFARYWGGALSTTLASAAVIGIGVLLVARIVLPSTIPIPLIISVAVSDLVFARLIDISGQAYQAHERLARTAQFPLLISVLRLGAALAFAALGHPTALGWALWYAGSTTIAAGIALAVTTHELGPPARVFGYPASELRQGAYFATSLSAQNIYNDIDKSMLARLSTLEATGIYGAAYRLVDVAFVPVRSLLAAAYPRFFRQGVHGVRASLGVARRLLPPAAAYSALAGAALFIVAPVLPRLLGSDFRSSIEATRWLAILPLLKSVHYFAADTLTGAGYQGRRTMAQLVVAAFNVVINVPLIMQYSWRGAAWSSIASDGLLAIMLWSIVWSVCRREDRDRVAANDAADPVFAVAGAARQ
jgi:O-antigen/teichoic acid export membrane protein